MDIYFRDAYTIQFIIEDHRGRLIQSDNTEIGNIENIKREAFGYFNERPYILYLRIFDFMDNMVFSLSRVSKHSDTAL